MSTVIQWVILLGILVAVTKLYEYFKEKKAEKEEMLRDIELQGKENMRLKSMITGKCPSCDKEKTDGELICECGFTYVDGEYCYNCDKYRSYDELNRGLSMVNTLNPVIYVCDQCKSKEAKKFK